MIDQIIKALSFTMVEGYRGHQVVRSYGSCDSIPNGGGEKLHSVLKHEVGVVQGARRLKTVPDDPTWIECSETDGYGDTGTKVIKIEGRILKSQRILETKKKHSQIENKSMMLLLNSFCLQNRIPLLSSNIGQDRSGGRRRSKSRSKTPTDQNTPGDDVGAEADWNSHRKSQRTGKPGSTAGGAGGGKRPHRQSSTSEPDSAWNLQVTDSSDQIVSSSAEVSTEINDNNRKRKSKRHEKIENEEHTKNREKTFQLNEQENVPAYEIFSSSTNLVQDHQKKSYGNESSSRRKKSKRKHDHVIETSDIFSIPTSSVSQSFQGKVRTGKSVHIEEPGGRESVSKNPTKNKQVKEYRRRSSYRKKLKSRKTLLQREDPFLIINLSEISKILRTERGNEWLEWTSSEDEAQDEDEDEQEHVKKRMVESLDKEKSLPQVKTDLKFFLKSTKILDRINSILGLNPYTKEVRNNQLIQVKWVPRSGAYIGVCLNALLFFATTIGIFYSLVVILIYEEPLQTTKKIVKTAFAHHFLEALFLMLLTLFLTIWSVSCILELGVHYAEFYNRFNLAICLIKYDVTEGIHEMIVKHLSTIFIFEFLIVTLFFLGYFHTSIVRESCGFLGFSILRPFNFELRESIYYPLTELFGLILFLYCFLCLNVVLLHFAVYAKALENMARRFNLRMAYAFGSLTEIYKSGNTRAIKKVIPFKKLFAEHQIITSLFRNIGQVNAIVFGAFIFSMICEIVLVMWLFFDMFLEEHPPFLAGVNIYRTGGVELAVPLRMQKSEGERLLKAFVICAITWLTFWIFGGVLHNAGEALHIGIEYVRRQGLMRCKSSNERRFVLSMMSSFSYKTPYWIGRRFQFTRTSFVALVSFVIGASMVTVAFRPDRLSLTSIETCNEHGDCTSVKIYKNAVNLLYATLDIAAPPPSTSPQSIGILAATTAQIDVNKTRLYPHLSFLQAPPCVSHGTYPIINSTIYGKLPAEWSFLPEIKLPLFYKPISFPSTPPAPSSPGDYVLYQAHNLLEPTPLFPYFVDCYQVNFSQDNCGNPGVALPSLSNFAVKISPPQIQLIAVNQNPDFDENDYRMFCCYKYAWSSENEVKVCNMRSKAELIRLCRLKSTWYRFFNASAASLRKLRRAGSGKRDDLGAGVPYDDPVRMSWTKCLCMSNATECKKVDPDWGTGTSTTRPPTKKPTTITTTTTLPPGTPGKPSCIDLPNRPSVTNKYFIKCPIPSKAGLWEDLPYIAHPFIFQKVKNGQSSRFKLHLKLKPTCNPDAEGNPLPSGTVDDSLQNGEDVYDCDENLGHHFSRDTNSYFEDECSNPILFYNTIWTPSKQRIRVVKLSESRVACCINYPLQNVPLSRKQALVCNNVEDVSFKCGNKTDNIREYCLSSFMKKWIQLDYNKRDRLESDKMVVKCMCNQLEYVQKTNTGLVNDQACHNYINSLK